IPKLLGVDGRKMSKSYDNFIALGDSEKTIKEKCAMMFTDPKRIKLSDKGHADECNLYHYFNLLDKKKAPKVYEYCTNAKKGCAECKKDLAGVVADYLSDIRKKREKLLKDKAALRDILKQGAKKARKAAAETMSEVRKITGLTQQNEK
ncbi:MAG: tryptophan--tRNA ligase, partial [Candidatus Omnitrophica bacterium]|nr:tryptophan--tRNA ligase [Candidatus Omnitrophota bacterium]